MPVRLMESLATTGEMAEIFSDHSVLEAMLAFEVGLARAEARLGLIPAPAAAAIAAAARTDSFDTSELAAQTLRAGTPGIPLSKALTERVRSVDASAAGFVHWGATSQDVADTAMVLLLKKARSVLERDLGRLDAALIRHSENHKNTVMLGRTLMQAAPPVTFGLKVAGWLGSLRRSRELLDDCYAAALILQFGGATGTMASLGDKGLKVCAELARDLNLALPEAPWHAHRDRLAALLSACGVLVGSLGKAACDIILLAQSEVGEVAEGGGQGRGGSSTMPHKQNPIGCTVTLAAAQRVPPLVATFLSSMVQQHERGVGGWQAEWSTVSSVIQATGLAIGSMAEVAEGLTVNAKRMRANIEATHGLIFAERAMMLLAPNLGRDAAHRLIEKASKDSIAQGKRLSEILAGMPEVTAILGRSVLSELEKPEEYLGAAEQLRVRLISKLDPKED
ncbi:MAG TPA: 3-carboxy-cis,cis-muconate cycloisomerase [Terriglobales bacterium]|nr:3-carboxy-cis,cis-muconate cycloisomerase [Terriglobales bacterium]